MDDLLVTDGMIHKWLYHWYCALLYYCPCNIMLFTSYIMLLLAYFIFWTYNVWQELILQVTY